MSVRLLSLGVLLLGLVMGWGGGTLKAAQRKIVASDGERFDRFGQSVAMDRDYLIIGAHREDERGKDAGSVYVYSRESREFLRKLTPTVSEPEQWFGWALAVHDGVLAVSAPRGSGGGAVYLFDLDSGEELQKVVGEDTRAGDEFGHAISLSANHLLVGAWKVEDDDNNPAEDSGAAYLFERSSGRQLHRLRADDISEFDQFGSSVALSGDKACVGAFFDSHNGVANAGSVYLFEVANGTQCGRIGAPAPAEGDVFGSSLAAGEDLLVVGAPEAVVQGENSGAAFLFEISTQSYLASLMPPSAGAGDRVGNAVAVDDIVILGSFRGLDSDKGTAHIFDLSGGFVKSLFARDSDTGDFFGHSVACSNGSCLVGALQDDDFGNSSGSAYLNPSEAPGILESIALESRADGMTLSWQATIGKTYSIYVSNNLEQWPPEPIHELVPATASASYLHADRGQAQKMFYRVMAE